MWTACASVGACVPELRVADTGTTTDTRSTDATDTTVDAPADESGGPMCSWGQPMPLTVGTPVTGMLMGTTSNNPGVNCGSPTVTAGPERVYVLDVATRSGFDVDFQRTDPPPDGGASDVVVLAIRPMCELSGSDIGCFPAVFPGSTNPRGRVVLEPGRYFFVVDAAYLSGVPSGTPASYSLNLTPFTLAPNAACATAAPIDPSGTPVMGDIATGGAPLPTTTCGIPGTQSLWYRASIPPLQNLQLTVSSSRADAGGLSFEVVDSCTANTCIASSSIGGSSTMPVPAQGFVGNESPANPRDVFIAITSPAGSAGPQTFDAIAQLRPMPFTVDTTIPVACEDLTAAAQLTPISGPTWTDDSNSDLMALPVTIPYMGGAAAFFSVTSNGFLQLYSTAAGMPRADYTNIGLPSPSIPSGMVAPFWDDLLPDMTGADIRMLRVTAAPAHTTIGWSNWTIFSEPNSLLNFQVKLFDTGEIEFHYCTLAITSGTAMPDRVYGSSATIGLEDESGTNGVLHSFNRVMAVASRTAIRFAPH